MAWASYCWSPYEPTVDILLYNLLLFYAGLVSIATMLEKFSGWWTFGFVVMVELVSLFSPLPLPFEKREVELFLSILSGLALGMAYLFRWVISTPTCSKRSIAQNPSQERAQG